MAWVRGVKCFLSSPLKGKALLPPCQVWPCPLISACTLPNTGQVYKYFPTKPGTTAKKHDPFCPLLPNLSLSPKLGSVDSSGQPESMHLCSGAMSIRNRDTHPVPWWQFWAWQRSSGNPLTGDTSAPHRTNLNIAHIKYIPPRVLINGWDSIFIFPWSYSRFMSKHCKTIRTQSNFYGFLSFDKRASVLFVSSYACEKWEIL